MYSVIVKQCSNYLKNNNVLNNVLGVVIYQKAIIMYHKYVFIYISLQYLIVQMKARYTQYVVQIALQHVVIHIQLVVKQNVHVVAVLMELY